MADGQTPQVDDWADVNDWEDVGGAAPAEKPGFFSGLAKGSALVNAVAHPIDTLGALSGQADIQEATRLYQNGDMKGAATKLMQWSAMGGPVPLTGMRLVAGASADVKGKIDQMRDEFKRGNYAGVLSTLTKAVVPGVEGVSEIAGGNPAGGAGMLAGNLLDFVAMRSPGVAKAAAGSRVGKAAIAGSKAAAPQLGVAAAKVAGGALMDQAGLPYHVGTLMGVRDATGNVRRGLKAGAAAAKEAYAPQVQSGPPPLPVQPPPLPSATAPIAEPPVTPAAGAPQVRTIPFSKESNPHVVAATKKAEAQSVKGRKMAEKLFSGGDGISSQDAARLTKDNWRALAKDLGITNPSEESIGEAMRHLRGMEDAAIKARAAAERVQRVNRTAEAEELARSLAAD